MTHPFREILDKYTDTEIARACYRQLWQDYDAGGHSMGRSIRSVWLEVANGLTGPTPEELSRLSDDQSRDFYFACEELLSDRRQERMKKDDEEFFAREKAEREARG